MAAIARYYSSTAVKTTISSSSIGASDTAMTVTSMSGFPASYPYTLILEKDSANEEIVTVTGIVGTALTIVRGVDGTTGRSHSAGTSVEHGVSALDFTNFRSHEAAGSNVHDIGAGAGVVGTTTAQTLSNKTLGSNLAAGGYKITGLADPTNAQDAATKNWTTSTFSTYESASAASASAAAASAATATTQATNAATSASNASSSAAAASASAAAAAASYDSFDDRYLGAKSSAPSTDNDGNSLVTGALYYLTTGTAEQLGMYAWDGSQWVKASAATQQTIATYRYTATANQTTFSGADSGSATLSYTIGLINVYLNGVLLVPTEDYTATNGTSVVLLTGASVGDSLSIVTFTSFNAANSYTIAQSDSTFLKQTDAASTYLTQSSAASTYATQSSLAGAIINPFLLMGA